MLTINTETTPKRPRKYLNYVTIKTDDQLPVWKEKSMRNRCYELHNF